MNQITVENFRCFRGEQHVRLAPLTLLVGENSTGKTSFLALIRALWDAAYRRETPDFKEAPYDLGSFDEIAHYRGGRAGRANEFRAGFRALPSRAAPTTADGDAQRPVPPLRGHIHSPRDRSGANPCALRTRGPCVHPPSRE